MVVRGRSEHNQVVRASLYGRTGGGTGEIVGACGGLLLLSEIGQSPPGHGATPPRGPYAQRPC
ncbi:hypothetical protein ACVWXB_007702 [Streptomyces sp. TE12347]